MLNARGNMVDLIRFDSIVAEQAANHLSDKYKFVPTMKMVDALARHQWYPTKAQEVKVSKRALHNVGFQRHLIRFRNDGLTAIKDGLFPEIVMVNSHDGSAAFQIMAGLYRLVCSNGLIVADSQFGVFRIKHMGFTQERVAEASEAIVDVIPKIAEKVNEFQGIELTQDEQGVFVESALQIKYDEDELKTKEIDVHALLRPRRKEDEAPSLWNTYNKVQENFINGGRYVRSRRDHLRKNRGTNNIHESVRINKALWMLTERMAELKG